MESTDITFRSLTPADSAELRGVLPAPLRREQVRLTDPARLAAVNAGLVTKVYRALLDAGPVFLGMSALLGLVAGACWQRGQRPKAWLPFIRKGSPRPDRRSPVNFTKS